MLLPFTKSAQLEPVGVLTPNFIDTNSPQLQEFACALIYLNFSLKAIRENGTSVSVAGGNRDVAETVRAFTHAHYSKTPLTALLGPGKMCP